MQSDLVGVVVSTLEPSDSLRDKSRNDQVDPFEAKLDTGTEVAYKPVKVELQVSSGKLVISGIDFIDEYTDGGTDSPQCSSKCGYWAEEKAKLEAYAERGLIWGYMGNSVPTIFQDGNSIVLGNNPDEESEYRGDLIQGEEVGSFCTDASSYFIADHDDYLSKGGKTDQHWEHQRPRIIDVEPGRYVVTHHFGFSSSFSDRDSGGRVVFVSLERSDEPVTNPAYPEELLQATVTKLFPDSRYCAIEVKKPFEEFEIKITFDQGAYTTATIPMDKISDEAFVSEAVTEAWQGNLEQREVLRRVQSSFREDMARMKEEEPERFAQLMQDIEKLGNFD